MIVVGTAAVALLNFHVVRTTIGMALPGPVLKSLSKIVSAFLLRSGRKFSAEDRFRVATGPFILVSTIALWWLALILAYFTVFLGSPDSIVEAKSGTQATIPEKLYFVIYTFSTLGLGDFAPDSDGWRILAAISSLNGLFIISLSVTYLIPVVSAVVQKRSLATTVNGLGRSPAEIVESLWDGHSFAGAEIVLVELSRQMESHTQRHMAYPVVHHFHSFDRSAALAPAMLNLSVAVDSIQRTVPPDIAPAPYSMKLIDQSFDNFAAMIASTFTTEPELGPEDMCEAMLDLSSLGIPQRQNQTEKSSKNRERDQLFRLFAAQAGWNRSSEGTAS